MQERGARFRDDLVAVAQVAVHVDPPPAALGHPRGDPELPVDEHRTPVADEDARRHGGEAVPGREQAARLVERGADEPAVDDSGARLVALAEREGRLVALDPFLRRERQVEAARILFPATPARGVMVGRDLYRSPPRSKCAR